MVRFTLRIIVLAAVLAAAAPAIHADWEQVAPGVKYQEFIEPGIAVHVTRVDLTNEAIRAVASNEEDRGLRVSEYAGRLEAIAAVNADYFDEQMNPFGVAAGPCGRWSGEPNPMRKQATVAFGEGRSRIYAAADLPRPLPRWIDSAVSGWPILVRDCQALGSKELPGSDHFTRAPHPRTAVGLSKSGRTLYLVVADGRREGVPGMTLPELALFMRERLRVCSAVNLDGGGSSAMALEGKIMNRPSDGTERRVSNHVAIIPASAYPACEQRPASGVKD